MDRRGLALSPARAPSRTPRRAGRRAASPTARSAVSPSACHSQSSPAHAGLVEEALNRLAEGLRSERQARDAFRKIDKDNSGTLDVQEFRLALRLLRLHVSARQATAIMLHLDSDGDGSISLDELMAVVWTNKLKLLRRKLGAAAYSIGGIDADKLFHQYDTDRSGELDFAEFQKAIRRDVGMVESDVPDDELREMFTFVDTDGSGKIGIDEFKRLLPNDEESRASRARYESVAGQAFTRILESADEQRANMLYLFHRFDTDRSGGLDRKEFRQAMLELGVALSASELRAVIEAIDADGNGFVTAGEFCDRMRVAKKDRRAVEGSSRLSPRNDGRRSSAGEHQLQPEPEPEPEPASEHPAPEQPVPEPEPEMPVPVRRKQPRPPVPKQGEHEEEEKKEPICWGGPGRAMKKHELQHWLQQESMDVPVELVVGTFDHIARVCRSCRQRHSTSSQWLPTMMAMQPQDRIAFVETLAPAARGSPRSKPSQPQ
jgi:Ca2+-binding EF-hand superfamily protein